MANKKISELTSRTPALSDLILVGDPSFGYSYKCTVTALATIIETDIADTYVTLGTTQTISGAKTFSNNLTLTSVANATITQTKFLTLNGSNVVNYRTGAEVLADIGGASSSSVSGTTNYLAKFTSSSAIGNSVIFESSGNIGIGVTTPFSTLDVTGSISINGRRVFNNSSADLFIGGLSGFAGRGTDTITFYTNNTSRAVFDINGNFGLGTSTPLHPLDVINSGGTGISTRNAETNYSILRIGTDVSNAYAFIQSGNAGTGTILPLTFRFGSNERMRLDASGNLGLGVSPASWYSTGYSALQVRGLSLYSAAGNDGNLVSNAYLSTAPAWTYLATGTATRYEQSSGSHKWYNAPSGTAGTAISFTQAMTLFSTGNLAVGGTSDGGYRLDVTGTFRNTLNTNTDAFQYISRFGALNGTGQLKVIDIAYTGSSNLITFNTNAVGTDPNIAFRIGSANPTMYITSSSVGIGTTSPSQKLSVFGGNLLVNNGVSPDANSGIRIVAPISTTQYNWMIAAQQNINNGFEITPSTAVGGTTFSTPALSVLASGSVGIGTSSPTQSLEVNGNVLVSQGAGNYPRFISTVGAKSWEIGYRSGTTNYEIREDGTTRMVIANGGNVGVGSTSPASLLTISGSTPTLTINRIAAGNQGKLSFTDQGTEFAYIQPSGATGVMRYDIGPSAGWGGVHAFFTDQSERMRITSGGAVGINTSSPDAGMALTLRESSTLSGALALINRNATKRYDLIIDVNSVDDGAFGIYDRTAGAYRQVITSGGNVLIGTTTDAGNKLQVQGGYAGFLASGTITLRIGADGSNDIYMPTGRNLNISAEDNLVFKTSGSLTERLRITSAGNVGLGTSTPLAVTNYIGQSISGTNGSFVSLYTGATQMGRIEVNSSTDFTIKSIANVPVIFGTNNLERMRIKSTGQVRFVPLAADPAGAESGDVYYNSTTNKLKVYNGTAWTDLH